MKRLLLLCSTLTSLFANGQTSIYHPFPDSNAVWNFHYQFNCFANGTANEYYSITFSGDTNISSQTYHKLTTPFVQSFSIGTCGGSQTGYLGAIRQDTAARKVFFVPPSTSSEELLYDFTMQVGDTVKGYTETSGIHADIVQSIDSVLIGSNYRKRWNINTCYNIQFIEGIGSTYGLYKLSPGCITDHADYALTCFQQNGQTLYPDMITNCELITSVTSVDNVLYQVEVYPNPSSGIVKIDFSKNEINSIKVYDELGQVLYSKSNMEITTKTTIDLSGLSAGLYFLELNSLNYVYKQRLILEK